jgi:hypothetical protein
MFRIHVHKVSPSQPEQHGGGRSQEKTAVIAMPRNTRLLMTE